MTFKDDIKTAITNLPQAKQDDIDEGFEFMMPEVNGTAWSLLSNADKLDAIAEKTIGMLKKYVNNGLRDKDRQNMTVRDSNL